MYSANSSWTWCARVRATNVANNQVIISAQYASGAYAVMAFDTSTIKFDYNGTAINFATGITNNTYYHVAIVGSGGAQSLWVNGVQRATGTAAAPAASNMSRFDIGSFGAGFAWITGDIQDVMVWPIAISSEDLKNQWNQRLPVRGSLAAWYPLHPGTGRTIDYSGLGRTLTVSGTVTDSTTPPVAGWAGSELTQLII